MAPIGIQATNVHIFSPDDLTSNVFFSTKSPLKKAASKILNGIISSTTKVDIVTNSKENIKYIFLPSNHPFLFPGNPNTPLSAPESDLLTVTDDYNTSFNNYGGLLGSSKGADTTALAWILPTVIGIVAAMVIIGLLCFFGVRAMELKCMRFCQTNCGFCCKVEEERDILTTREAINQTEMTNYKSAFTPDSSGTW